MFENKLYIVSKESKVRLTRRPFFMTRVTGSKKEKVGKDKFEKDKDYKRSKKTKKQLKYGNTWLLL